MRYNIKDQSGFDDIVFVSKKINVRENFTAKIFAQSLSKTLDSHLKAVGCASRINDSLTCKWPPPESLSEIPFIVALESQKNGKSNRIFIYIQSKFIEVHFPENLFFRGEDDTDEQWAEVFFKFLRSMEIIFPIEWDYFEASCEITKIPPESIGHLHKTSEWNDYKKKVFRRICGTG